MKKFIFSCIIVVFLLLTSCQTKAPGETGRPVDPQVTLKFTTWTSAEETQSVFNEFVKKYPNIKLKEEVLDSNHYDVLMKTRILSGDPPDVLLITGQQYYNYANLGWLMDVTYEPASLRMQATKLSDVFGIIRNGDNSKHFFGGSVSGGPNDFPIYYNKKYFKKLGIHPPASLDEFYAICDKIKADGIDPLVIGIADRWPLDMIMAPFIDAETLGKYPKLFDALYFNKVRASDAYQSSLSFIDTLMRNQYIGKASLTLSYKQSLRSFVAGKAAMLPMGGWAAHEDAIRQADPSEFELGLFSLPLTSYNGKKHLGVYLQSVLGIYTNSKHPEEAKKLFNFFLEKNQLKHYIEDQGLGSLDPGLEIHNLPVLSGFVNELQDTAKYEIHYSDYGTIKLSPSFSNAVKQSIYNIVGGSIMTVELKKLDVAMERYKDEATGTGIAQSWGFNTDGDTEGWSSPNMVIDTEGGRLNILSKAVNPYIISTDLLDIPTKTYRFLHIRFMSAAQSFNVQLNFTTREDNNWDAAKSISFITEPNVEKEYVIDMSSNPYWRGLIRQLLISPFSNVGSANIDFISVTTE